MLRMTTRNTAIAVDVTQLVPSASRCVLRGLKAAIFFKCNQQIKEKRKGERERKEKEKKKEEERRKVTVYAAPL